MSGPGNTNANKKLVNRGFDSGAHPAADAFGAYGRAFANASFPDDLGQRNVRHQPINGVERPRRDQVMGMGIIRNLVNLGPQLTDHVLMRHRASKEVFPSGTPTGEYQRDQYGRLRAYHIRARIQHPGGPETHGLTWAPAHDPIDGPPTSPKNPEPLRQLPPGMTRDFPKMNNTVSNAGVVTRVPGEGLR